MAWGLFIATPLPEWDIRSVAYYSISYVIKQCIKHVCLERFCFIQHYANRMFVGINDSNDKQNNVKVSTLRTSQIERHFAEKVFKYIIFIETRCFWFKFHWRYLPSGLLILKSALAQVMVWCRSAPTNDEPMVDSAHWRSYSSPDLNMMYKYIYRK